MKIFTWLVAIYLFLININTINKYGGEENAFAIFQVITISILFIIILRLAYECVAKLPREEYYTIRYVQSFRRFFASRGLIFSLIYGLAGVVGLIVFLSIANNLLSHDLTEKFAIFRDIVIAPLLTLLIALLVEKFGHGINISIYKRAVYALVYQGLIVFVNIFTYLTPVGFIFVAFIIYFQACSITGGGKVRAALNRN